MTNRAILAGTLASILAGTSYLSAPLIARDPPIRTSPSPSASSLEDIAKLKEKMRSVCLESLKYQMNNGGFFGRPPFQNICVKEGNTLYGSLLNNIPRSACIPSYIEGEEAWSIDQSGQSDIVSRKTMLQSGFLSNTICRAYELGQRKAQEAALRLQSDVKIDSDIIIIKNPKASVLIYNARVRQKARVAEEFVRTGRINHDILVIQYHSRDGYILQVEDLLLGVLHKPVRLWYDIK